MPTLDLAGATLGYETRGSGWPLLFLHGAWVDREQWAPQVERFADSFEVVTPDLRGHGDSVADGDLDLGEMAGDVAALCDELGLASPVVCGLSMGGLVAQRFALDHPDRVAGLVLANTVRSVPPVPGPEAARRALFPTGPAKWLVRLWGPGAYFRGLLAGVEATQGRWLALDAGARTYALDRVDAFSAGEFLAVLDAFHEHRPAEFAALSVPTLLLYGDHEAAPVKAQNRTMERAIPDVRREVVPDAGHLSNRDNPAAFGDLLDGFLDERVTVPA
jgi:pimeloyl-ACP methyl ester carboxylesterase